MRRRAKWIVAAAIALFLFIIGIASGHSGTQPVNSPSPEVSASPASTPPLTTATPSVSATHTVAAPKTARAAPRPSPPPASLAPVSTPACYPLTSGGNCYRPGEFCPHADHGMSGVSGDGEAIICKDNGGWRWEPA